MSSLTRWVVCVVLVPLAFGCDPYKDYRLSGEFNAGSADPTNFPPPYRGAGATRTIAGSGTGFVALRAYVDGRAIEYFSFPYPPTQVVRGGYPYSYTDETAFYDVQRRNATRIGSFPASFIFDPPGGASAFPVQQQCRAPSGYSYDERRDDVRYDEQGSIFTALPEATFGPGSLPSWTYVPIVAEVPVSSAGEPCQEIKSDRTLLTRTDVNVGKDAAGNAQPDGRYLAWALIDPGSGVYHVGESTSRSRGTGIQRWGWFNRFLVAYLDGGYIPRSGSELATQILYIPSKIIPTQPDGGPAAVNGKPGAGYDVLEFARGDPRYTPICRVQIYDTGDGLAVTRLPQTAEGARAMNPHNPAPPPSDQIAAGDVIPPFLFCLQTQ